MKAAPSGRWSDDQVEAVLANWLRAGVWLAASVVAGGGIVFLWRHGRELPHYRPFAGEPPDLRTVSGIVKGVATLKGRAIIQLGLLLLVATPVARVALAAIGFELQRDWLYVLLTLAVLGILLFSLAGGHL